MSPRAWMVLGISHLVIACSAGGALAADVPAAPPAAPHVSPAPATQPLNTDEMSAISGGTALTNINTLTQQQLTATTSGNTITAGVVTSGAVTFSPQALAGFNGVGNFVINTGANNSLQGAINLSIVTAPPS